MVEHCRHILISRTDSIGDVVLTLPMCAAIKEHLPDCKITFIARSYTIPVIRACRFVDNILNWDEMSKTSPADQIELLVNTGADAIIHVFPTKKIIWLAKRARIKLRIATGRRWYTLTKCNKLVFFSRKKSQLHESQLNMKLLSPLGITGLYTLPEIATMYGLSKLPLLPERLHSMLNSTNKKIIIHPKSKGSAVEWSLASYSKLISSLDGKNVQVFITGTEQEKKWVSERISWPKKEYVEDLSGTMNLDEFIAFINACDILIAASTGPLHIASALGKKAIGLYSPKRPIHPVRWAPIGTNAEYIVAPEHPQKGEPLNIESASVLKIIEGYFA